MSQYKCLHCRDTGMMADFLGYSESPCDCRRAVPYQPPPEGDYPPRPQPAHRPYHDSQGNLMAHGGYSDEQLLLYAATDRAQRIAPAARLTKPARVGGGIFGTGVPERLVIEAAQRHYEYKRERASLTPEQQAEKERSRRALWDMTNGPLAAAPQAPAAPVDDLVQLVQQLVRALRKAAPGNDLADKALDYIKRQGLQGSALRAAPDAPPTHAGLLAAAAHIQAKAQAHAEECGSYDPDTGAVEMSNSNQEHFNTLDELAEEIRLMAAKGKEGVKQ